MTQENAWAALHQTPASSEVQVTPASRKIYSRTQHDVAQYWDIDNHYCTQSRKEEGGWEETQESFELFDWIHCGIAHWAVRGRLRLWSCKEPEGKSEQKFNRYKKGSIFFFPSFLIGNFFSRILVHSPRQLQCQGTVEYSARAVWKKAINNWQGSLELSNYCFVFARPSVWLFGAVQHCVPVLCWEVCSKQITGIRSLARSCSTGVGWGIGLQGQRAQLCSCCKAVIND